MHMTSLTVKFNIKSSHPLTQISLSLSLQTPVPKTLLSLLHNLHPVLSLLVTPAWNVE